MNKILKLLSLLLAACMLLAATAFAAEGDAADSFDVSIVVNGNEYANVAIGTSVEDNVYTFEITDFLNTVGLELHYDEASCVAVLSAVPGSISAVLLSEAADEAAAAPVPGKKESIHLSFPQPIATAGETSATAESTSDVHLFFPQPIDTNVTEAETVPIRLGFPQPIS